MNDPRGLQGQMARGSNIYMGAGNSSYVGKPPAMTSGKQFPTYKKLSLQDVARKALGGNGQ